METQHPEDGESPFLVRDDTDTDFATCPIDGCGEIILLTELDSHLEMHDMEGIDEGQEVASTAMESGKGSSSFNSKRSGDLRNIDAKGSSSGTDSSGRQASAKAAWKEVFKFPEVAPKSASSPKGKSKSLYRRLGVNIPGSTTFYSGIANP